MDSSWWIASTGMAEPGVSSNEEEEQRNRSRRELLDPPVLLRGQVRELPNLVCEPRSIQPSSKS